MPLISKRLSLFSLPNTYRLSSRKNPGFSGGWACGEGTGWDREAGMGWWGRERGLHSPALQMPAALWPSERGRDETEPQLWDAVLPRAHFLSPKWQPRGYLPRELISLGFFSTLKKQTQAPQPVLCCGSEPSRLAWLASHKGSIKLFIKMLPFISAR